MADKVINLKLNTVINGQKQVVEATANLRDLERAAGAARDKVNAITFAAIADAAGKAQQAVQGLASVMQDLADAYAVQEAAETKLQTVMRQRMNATDDEIQSIKDLCSAQQELGVIGDEVQLAGAQQIATFITEKASLETLIPAMNNLLAQQKGLNATGEDAVTIGNLIGKVMQGQTTALKRVGITFSDAQAEALKFGDEQQRAAILAQIITDNVGNMNAELAKTDSGKQKQLSNYLGDVKEQLGGLVKGALPFVQITAACTTSVTGVVKLTAAFKAMFAAMRSGLLTTRALSVALKGLAIGAGIGAALWAITEIYGKLNSRSKELRATTQAYRDELEGLKRSTTDVRQATNQYASESLTKLNQLYNVAKDETKSLKDRQAAIAELKREFPGYFSNIDSEKINIKDLTGDYNALTQAIMRSAEARAMQDKMAENSANKLNAIDKMKELTTLYKEQKKAVEQAYSALESANQNAGNNPGGQLFALSAYKQAKEMLDQYEQQLNSVNESIAQYNKANQEMAGKIAANGGTGLAMGNAGPGTSGASAKKATEQANGIIAIAERKLADLQKRLRNANSEEEVTSLNQQIQEVQKEILRLNSLGIEAQKGLKQEADIVVAAFTDEDVVGTIKQITDNIAILQDQLANADISDARGIQEQIKHWEKLRDTILGVADDSTKMQDSANKNVTVMNAMGNAMQQLSGVVGEGAAGWLQWGANVISTIAATLPQLAALIGGNIAQAFSGAIANSQMLPPPWNLIQLAANLAAVGAAVAGIPKFAEGGIAYGPTLGLFGEYGGASNNPEVVAPRDKLKALIGDSGSGGKLETVEVRIKGRDLVAVLAKENNYRNRM